MGLAGAKNRRKISKDPNNTRWARKTDNFGQKILRSQGWEPGQYLGAKDASHAEFHTAANASHIRVILKEDNLGLGAKRNQGDECTGLDGLKDLLGRLNGKSEEVIEKERKTREGIKMSLYLERKFGNMRFVSGGLLVGDKIAGLQPEGEESPSPSGDGAETPASDDTERAQKETKKEKKSKKRKADAGEGALATETAERREKKKRKKEKRQKAEEGACEAQATGEVGEQLDRGKGQEDLSLGTHDSEYTGTKPSRKEKKKKSKKSKKSESNEGASPVEDDSGAGEDLDRRKTDGVSTPLSESDRPAVSGRHLARRRFIAQKRQALLDPQALNQIFMIKT